MTQPYPPYPQYPPQQYPPQPPPAYQPQPAYPQGYPPQYLQPGTYNPTAPPAAHGSLSDYYDAPSSAEGRPWSFTDANRQPILGSVHVGIVARELRDGDVRQQTNPNNNQPVTYRDGRPKWVMVVPMLQQPDPNHPDGRATWWVRGQARDELMRAMKTAGCDEQQLKVGPEAGAGIRITLVSVQPVPGMNPRSIFQIEYTRPADAQQKQMQFDPPLTQPPPTPPAASPSPQPPPDMTPEQQELLARLTNRPPAG